MAAEMMYRKEWNSCSAEECKRRLKIDYMLNEYFGDSLVPRRQQYTNLFTVCSKTDSSVDNTSVNSDNSIDFDFDYENWNPSYMIQRRPFMQNTNPYVIKNVKEPVNIFTVFESCYRLRKDIIFNFEGSNQIDYRELKCKKLDPNHIVYQSSIYRLSYLWYTQNIFKNTRTIKYCKHPTKYSPCNLFTLL